MPEAEVIDLARVTPVPPSRIAHEWETISELILPAIKDNVTEMELFGRLVSGHSQAVTIVSPRVTAVAVLHVGYVGDVYACFVSYVGGKYDGAPKALSRFIRGVMRTIESKAKDIGCHEVRLGGRKTWGLILSDYSKCDGMTNGLRKAL
jgi:hypothetical protein